MGHIRHHTHVSCPGEQGAYQSPPTSLRQIFVDHKGWGILVIKIDMMTVRDVSERQSLNRNDAGFFFCCRTESCRGRLTEL